MNWFKNYKTKSEELNKRQNEFINIYEDFKLTLSGDKDRANREVGKIIVYLVNYVTTYFALEEEYLKKIDFQEYESHKSHHKEFTIKVFEVLNSLKNKQVYRPIQLHYLLDGWFQEHIITQDSRFLIEGSDDLEKLSITNREEVVNLIERGYRPIDHMFSKGRINDKVREDKRIAHFKEFIDSIDRIPDKVNPILKESIVYLFENGTIEDLEYKKMINYITT